MAKKESAIDVQVERADSDGRAVQKVAVAVSGGCSIEVVRREGAVVVQLSLADSSVCLATDGPHSDFARAINLLRLHLPRSRA